MTFKDLEEKLLQLSEQHDLVELAKASCRVAIYNSAKDFPEEGYPVEEVDIKFERLNFVFRQDLSSVSIIKTQMGLYHIGKIPGEAKESKRFGHYTLDTDESGNVIDDWLVFDTRLPR